MLLIRMWVKLHLATAGKSLSCPAFTMGKCCGPWCLCLHGTLTASLACNLPTYSVQKLYHMGQLQKYYNF